MGIAGFVSRPANGRKSATHIAVLARISPLGEATSLCGKASSGVWWEHALVQITCRPCQSLHGDLEERAKDLRA